MRAPTLSKVRDMIASANSISKSTLRVEWVTRCKMITYPTGAVGMYGTVKASAPGFKTRILPVSVDTGSLWVGR